MVSTAREKRASASPPNAHTSRSLRPESIELGEPWRSIWVARAPPTRSLTKPTIRADGSSRQLLARETRYVDEDIHAVEQGPGDAGLVAFDLARCAPAGPPLVASVPAGTRVHGT